MPTIRFGARRRRARRMTCDPRDVIRVFWRTLEQLAARDCRDREPSGPHCGQA